MSAAHALRKNAKLAEDYDALRAENEHLQAEVARLTEKLRTLECEVRTRTYQPDMYV